MATSTKNIIIGNFHADKNELDEPDEFDELFLLIFGLVIFEKTFIFPFFDRFALFLFVFDDIKLFAKGAIEFTVVVAAVFAKSETEFNAEGSVSVAKSETEFNAPTVADGTV
jgi:hypothetical protein